MGGRLIRRTSPSTRIIGGRPADRCKSDAPCFAEKARSSVISIVNKPAYWSLGAWGVSLARGALFKTDFRYRHNMWFKYMQNIADNLTQVRRLIQQNAQAAGRNPSDITLLAVS